MTKKKRFPQALRAVRHLSKADRVLGKIMKRVGPVKILLNPAQSVFESIASSIVFQQLHGKAAGTILERFKVICGGGGEIFPEPHHVLTYKDEELRAAGLSRAKLRAIQDLSQKVIDGQIPHREAAHLMEDEALIAAFSQVKGVGEWTAQMLLIFTLGRPDVLPTADYGIRKGYAKVYGKRKMPTPKQLEKYAEKWKPYRSVACWYLWRALELKD